MTGIKNLTSNKKLVFIAAIVLITVASFLASFAVAQRKNGSSSPSLDAGKDAYNQRIDASGAILVDLTKDGASPDQVTVEVGKSVQFNSKDGKKHALSLGEGTGKRSSGMDASHDSAETGHNDDASHSDDYTHSEEDASKPHEHASDDFASGEFGADEAWRVTFSKPGTFFFHDHFNPDLNILVVAYEPAKN